MSTESRKLARKADRRAELYGTDPAEELAKLAKRAKRAAAAVAADRDD